MPGDGLYLCSEGVSVEINPFASEAERLWFVLDFVHRCQSFLTLLLYVLIPWSAINLADYFILRRQRLDLRALHSTKSDSAYRFWHGFNPIGLFSLAVGFLVYIAVFNPQSLAHAPVFLLLTASVPSCLAAGACHLVLTRVFARRRGWGAYPQRGAACASPAISR